MEKRVTRLAAVVPWFTFTFTFTFTSLALPVLSGCTPGLASGGEPDAAFEAVDGGSPSLVAEPEAGLAEGDAVPDAGDDGEDPAVDGPCEGAAEAAAADAPPAEASVDASDDVPPGPPMQPSCPTGHVVCGNACVDLQTDANHCGACGHACAPGACASGACQPWIVVSGVDPAGIACDGVNLVWANVASPDVQQVPSDGSANDGGAAKITLSQRGTDPVVAVAMKGSTVAWATLTYSTQQSTLWAGAESASYSGVAVGTPLDPVSGLALDPYGGYAYVATSGSAATGTIWQCNVAGTSPSCASIASVSSSRLGQVAVDDQSVYWTDPANAFVSRYGNADRTVTILATGQKSPTAIALDAANVYWVTGNGAASSMSGWPKNSAAGPSLLATAPGNTMALATDGVNLYVATYGVIESVPVTGGSLTARHASATPNTSAITQIVYAAGAIYWGDRGPQAIYGMRVR